MSTTTPETIGNAFNIRATNRNSRTGYERAVHGHILVSAALAAVLMAACGGEKNAEHEALRADLDRTISDAKNRYPQLPSIIAKVYSPRNDFTWVAPWASLIPEDHGFD